MESMLGQTFDLDDISVIETDSFQYGDKCIICMSAINEETCFVSDGCNPITLNKFIKGTKMRRN